MVPLGTPCATASCRDHGLPRLHWQGHPTTSKYHGTKFRKAAQEKDVGPTHRFTEYPEVGSGVTIGTLQIKYPHVQALSQDKGQDVCSHVSTCPQHRVMSPAMGSLSAATPLLALAPAF
jgi:hypothetical protein